MCLVNLFTDIAEAIRAKNGSSDLINATDFPKEIENLQTGGNGDIKGFSTVDEMNASTGNKEGDKAVVYYFEKRPVENYKSFKTLYFPETVVLDTAITATSSKTFKETGSSGFNYYVLKISIDVSSVKIYAGKNTSNTVIAEYSSEDGLTFTRTTTTENYTLDKLVKDSNAGVTDVMQKFLITKRGVLDNMYVYDELDSAFVTLDFYMEKEVSE